MTEPSKQNNNNNSVLVPVILSSSISIAAVVCGYFITKQQEKWLRSRWLEEEKQKEINHEKEQIDLNFGDGDDDDDNTDAPRGQEMPSVIGSFKGLELSSQSTVFEANRRRTTSYYEKMREARLQSLVLGASSYSQLIKDRQKEMDKLLFYAKAYKEGKKMKSLRTVIIMIDQSTQNILSEARQKILSTLQY